MNTLVDSLAWTLIHFLWQGMVIALAAHGLLFLLRRRSANLRYLVALSAMFMMVVTVAGTYRHLRGEGHPVPVRRDATATAVEPVAGVAAVFEESSAAIGEGAKRVRIAVRSVAKGVTMRTGFRFPDWRRCLAIGWITGVGVIGLWRFTGLVGIARLRRRSRVAPATLAEDFVLLRTAMRISGRVALRVSEIARVPKVVGILRPLVLVPVSAVAGLTPDQLRAVLAHELAHVRRHDYLVNLVQVTVETLLFVHPCVWWLGRTIRRERENACDDSAVAHCSDKILYARALGELVRLTHAPGPALAMTSGKGRGEVLGRITRILSRRPAPDREGWLPVLVLLGILAAGGLATRKAMAEPGKETKPVAEARGRILDRNGRVLAETVDGERRYAYGALAAHVLGYVGREPTAGGMMGRGGVEFTGEKRLKEGDLTLTLDLEKQFVVESVLREQGIGRGAVVVLDPQSGDVLAMASVPSYDLNLWVPVMTQENWDGLMDDETRPLLNRALGVYAPGSVFKIATALTVRDAKTKYTCLGALKLPSGNVMLCWIGPKGGQHGEIGLSEAVDLSCNCYFYQAGIEAGMDRLHDTAALLGLGRSTGIELMNESSGNVPDEAFLRARDISRSDALNANTAIGQGYCEATPVQIAAAVAAIGNGGLYRAPRLFLEREKSVAASILEQGVEKEVLGAVRQALRRAVNDEGHVGGRAESAKLEIAGKTGTAQFQREGKPENIGWFVSFAPYDNPRYAMAVMVQGAKSGGRVCAPLTRMILERLAYLDAGATVEVVPLEAAKGHLEAIEAID